jgi:hypothetical protein
MKPRSWAWSTTMPVRALVPLPVDIHLGEPSTGPCCLTRACANLGGAMKSEPPEERKRG